MRIAVRSLVAALALAIAVLTAIHAPVARADITPGCSVDINSAGRNWFMAQFTNMGCVQHNDPGGPIGDFCENSANIYYICHASGNLFEYYLDTGAAACSSNPTYEGDAIYYRIYGGGGQWVQFSHPYMHCSCPNGTGATCGWN